jgi:type IV fimbrial biogenesis protein FimT
MKAQKGLTLVELMVTLAVAITLLALGVPLFQNIQANNRVAGQSNSLVTAMTLARSTALGRGVPVALCAKADPAPANTACGGAGDWANGWQVFIDDGTTAGSYNAADEQRVRVFDAPSGTPAFTASTGSLRYLATGELDSAVNGSNEWFRVAQTGYDQNTRCLRVNVVGQLRSDKMLASDACP